MGEKKKTEVDSVLQLEAYPKLVVKFHKLTGHFDLVLLVSFHEDG